MIETMSVILNRDMDPVYAIICLDFDFDAQCA